MAQLILYGVRVASQKFPVACEMSKVCMRQTESMRKERHNIFAVCLLLHVMTITLGGFLARVGKKINRQAKIVCQAP